MNDDETSSYGSTTTMESVSGFQNDSMTSSKTTTTLSSSSLNSEAEKKVSANNYNNRNEEEDENDEQDDEDDDDGTSTDEEKKKTADEFRNQGNEAFANANYYEAIRFYTMSIQVFPTPQAYANRAFAYLRTESFGSAVSDSQSAIALDKEFIKAYYRLGSAYIALGKYNDGLNVFKHVIKLKPKNKDARAKYAICLKEVKRRAFEAAIAVDDVDPLWKRLEWQQTAIPEGYDGPIWDDHQEISKDFVENMVEAFRMEKKIPKKYAYRILVETTPLLRGYPTLLRIPLHSEAEVQSSVARHSGHISPLRKITVCGDTHGQFYDLLNIFKINGAPSKENPYLFNGDFVDRGSWSLEVILTLLMYKLLDPDSIHLLRGNHETKNMNKLYGFESEVIAKLDDVTMELFFDLFQSLPLCAVIGGKVITMHGGLFQKDDVTLDDIEKISRFREPPEDGGLMSDILWSDPQPFKGRMPSKRGVGQSFGPDITKAFLEKNGLDLLVRSHEVRQEGYLIEHDGKLVTVFSAPNYCDSVGNKGAYIQFFASSDGGVDFSKTRYETFTAVEHPNLPPMAYATVGLGSILGL